MTDLEMMRLCAEAMGLEVIPYDGAIVVFVKRPKRGEQEYRPLHDDAQAMALVKKFNLTIRQICLTPNVLQQWQINDGGPSNYSLNRAIVECVAKMQKARSTDA